jgi:hypothetical protein
MIPLDHESNLIPPSSPFGNKMKEHPGKDDQKELDSGTRRVTD